MGLYKVIISDDKELVWEIDKQLALNGGYCPCRVDHTDDTICMCKEFRDQIKDDTWFGECHCGKYIKIRK